MTIGIDGNEANVEKKVGISEYAFELIKEFSHANGIDFTVYLKGSPRLDLPIVKPSWKYRIVKPSPLWTQIGLPIDLFSHFPRPKVFFSPTHYAPRFSPVPTAISVMDLSYIYFPELFASKDLYQLKQWTKYSIKNAARVFTISQASKDDILKVYNIPEKKVIVTYPGIKTIPMATKDAADKIKNKYDLSSEYILFVGTLQPRKNISALVEAFAYLHKEKKVKDDVQLVVVGKKGWLYEDIIAAPEKFGVASKVKFLEFVSDEDLAALYKHALFFVLPSLYEGFGLPVLEAMKYGCPVITSNVSSLPEVGGDAVLYVDPKSVHDIALKMEQLSNDKKLRDSLRERGYKQIEKFSWEKTAKETLATLEEVAGGNDHA